MLRPVKLCANTVVAAIVFASAPFVAGAQIIRDSTPAASPSVAAHAPVVEVRSAVAAQADFEDFRLENLPPPITSMTAICGLVMTSCRGEAWQFASPPAEPAAIRERREQFVALLDTVAMNAPEDRWAAEQRVRYLAEAGRFDSALVAAKACREGGWRCDALVGFSLHLLGRYVAADSAYAHALARMLPSERCAWRNLDPLIDDDTRERYVQIPCNDPRRDAFEDRIWFFARTLYSLDGNDSRTEYYARKTMELMLGDAPGISVFPQDYTERVLQMSWPRGWAALKTSSVPLSPTQAVTQMANRVAGTARTSYFIANYMPAPAYRYVPAGTVLLDPSMSDSSDWSARHASPKPLAFLLPLAKIELRLLKRRLGVDTTAPAKRTYIARYAPTYAKSLTPLEHQEAIFKRGDSALVVMAYDARTSQPLAGAKLTAALVVSPSEKPANFANILHDAPETGVLTVKAPWGRLLMSAEVYSLDKQAVARSRYGISPPFSVGTRVTLSDLLFYQPYGTFPKSAEEAAPHALPTVHLHANEKLGVFWESYGTDAGGEKMKVSLTVMKEVEESGFVKKGAQALGLVREPTPVIVSVEDISAVGKSVTPRGLEVDISTLKEGSYIAELEIEVAGQYAVRAEHRIEIIGP